MAKVKKLNPSAGAENTPVDKKLPVPTQVLDVPSGIAADLTELDRDIVELGRQIEVIKQRKQDIIYGFLAAHNVEKGTPFGVPPTHDKISIFTKEELERAKKAAMEAPPVDNPESPAPTKEEQEKEVADKNKTKVNPDKK